MAEVIDTFWKIKGTKCFRGRDLNTLSRDVRATSPFTGDNGNQILQMTMQYMYDTKNEYVPLSDELYEFCHFCGMILPQWVRVLMHGYFNDLSVVEAYHDFVKQVKDM